jgi:hypothetical protein
MKFINKFFIWWCIIYFYFFHTTLTFFWVNIFHLFFVTNVMLSFQKFITSSSSLKSFKKFMMNPIKIYDNMNNEKINDVNLNMALNFKFVCNTKQLQAWQFKLFPYSCFHLNTTIDPNLVYLPILSNFTTLRYSKRKVYGNNFQSNNDHNNLLVGWKHTMVVHFE